MGVYTFTIVDVTSSIAPARLFKAMCLDNHNLFPKVAPHSIKSIDFVEGDCVAVGCVKQYNFADGAPFKYAKSKVNELDTNNCYIKYTIFEGGNLEANKLECVVYESKAEPSGSGSHYTMVGHFHTKGDGVVVEEDVKGALKNLQMTFKAAEEYLVSNPHEYA